MLAVPVAVVVTTVAQAPEAMAAVPRADVPLAMVCVRVAEAGIVVPFTLVVLLSAAGTSVAARARKAGAPAVANNACVVVVSALIVEEA